MTECSCLGELSLQNAMGSKTICLCASDVARTAFLGQREASSWPTATIPSVYRAGEGRRVLNTLGWGC